MLIPEELLLIRRGHMHEDCGNQVCCGKLGGVTFASHESLDHFHDLSLDVLDPDRRQNLLNAFRGL